MGTGGIDDFVEAEGGGFEFFGEEGGGLALVLEDDEVEVSGLYFFDGFGVGEVEGEGFAAGVDEGELGFGVGGGFDEFGDGLADAAGVAVADEEDFFGLFGGWCFGLGLSECREGLEGEDAQDKEGFAGHFFLGDDGFGVGVLRWKEVRRSWVPREVGGVKDGGAKVGGQCVLIGEGEYFLC